MTEPEGMVHGLDGQLVAPDWPVLEQGEVEKVLEKFPQAGGAVRILTYSPRPFSAASVVETRDGKIFVKRHHRSVRNATSLMEEHQWMEYLSGRTPLVKAPLKDVDGQTVVTSEEWTYEVHPHGDGVDVYWEAQSWTPFLSVGHAKNAGRALAKLHAASEGYEGPERGVAPLITGFRVFASENPWDELVKYAAARPALRDYLAKRDFLKETRETFSGFYEKLQPYLGVFESLWTHNDFHASNLLWSGDAQDADVTDIFDFGLSNRTNAIHDIATAIERNGVDWLEIGDGSRDVFSWEQIEAFLQGYEELRRLSRDEARALAVLLPMVHAEFALTETDYFLRSLKSEEKADVAYQIYFLGHARWFDEPAGKKLLGVMEDWAEKHRRS
jgi:Ser/Thr protein kinase RdoA (MazF antagonist)